MSIDIWGGWLGAVYLGGTLIAGWGWGGWDTPNILTTNNRQYITACWTSGCLGKCIRLANEAISGYHFLFLGNSYDNASWFEIGGNIYDTTKNIIYAFPFCWVWDSANLYYWIWTIWGATVVWYYNCYYCRSDYKTHYRYRYINPETCCWWMLDCCSTQHSWTTHNFCGCSSYTYQQCVNRWWKCVYERLTYAWW